MDSTLCTLEIVFEMLHAFQYSIPSFSFAHQLLFCAMNVPEKYATGLISWSLSTSWQRMLEYALLEASVYSTYGVLGSRNCNNGLLQKTSFKYSNASWHLSDQTIGVFFFIMLVIGRVISAKAGMNEL